MDRVGNYEINKIYNIDCNEALQKLPDSAVDLILTDIPYGNVSRNGEERAKYGGQLRKIDKKDADVITFDLDVFLDECYRVCKGSIYIFCGIEQISHIFHYFDSKKDMSTRQCIWHKTNPSPVNGQYYWIHAIENCIFAKKRKTTFNQHCKHNVWSYPVGRSKLHPTQKPLTMFQYIVESSTNEGDIVLDPCIGSGTSAIAAKTLKRNFLGFDISSNYVNISNQRLSEIK